VRLFFTKMCVFWKKKKIQAQCGRFSHDPNFFLCSKVLAGFKYAKKRGYQENFEKGRFSSHPNVHRAHFQSLIWKMLWHPFRKKHILKIMARNWIYSYQEWQKMELTKCDCHKGYISKSCSCKQQKLFLYGVVWLLPL
jgi:hypothetical protein